MKGDKIMRKVTKEVQARIDELTLLRLRARTQKSKDKWQKELNEISNNQKKRKETSKVRLRISPELIVGTVLAIVQITLWWDIERDGIVRSKLSPKKFGLPK